MSKKYLLGTALTAALVLAPGLALAQNNTSPNANNGVANAGPMTNNGEYANIGRGGYTGTPMTIQNNNSNGGGWLSGNNNNNANNGNWRPSQRNPVLADNGDARAGKLIGSDVYSTQDQKLGSVDDVLIGRNGVFAVISTNNKKVAVPFQYLVFGNASANGDQKVVLPNATQAQLNTLPVFHYNETNYANNNGGNNGGWSNNGNSNANWNNRNTNGVFGNRNNPNNG